MVSTEYCQLLSRYNRWMNERLYQVVAQLPAEERVRDMGAFFGSIERTLNHVLWGDRVWLARFTGEAFVEPAYGATMFTDFATLARERDATDLRLLEWSGALSAAWLQSTLHWRAYSDGRLRQLPAWIGATHLFAHATHHRGQLSTLLTQQGVDPGVTDLPYLPGGVRFLD